MKFEKNTAIRTAKLAACFAAITLPVLDLGSKDQDGVQKGYELPPASLTLKEKDISNTGANPHYS